MNYKNISLLLSRVAPAALAAGIFTATSLLLLPDSTPGYVYAFAGCCVFFAAYTLGLYFLIFKTLFASRQDSEPLQNQALTAHWLLAPVFNRIQQKLNNLMVVVNKSSATIQNNSVSLAESSSEVSALVKSIDLMTEKSNEISQASSSIRDAAGQVNSLSIKAVGEVQMARTDSEAGQTALSQVVHDIRELEQHTLSTSERILNLRKRSENIQQIVQVIKEIADQTNLLALNAAIEAARAGESGRGFAVVADEVRKLAEKTANSTQQITQQVSDIHTETGQAVDIMANLGMLVNRGAANIETAGSQLETIVRHSSSLENEISDISAHASRNQQEVENILNSIGIMREQMHDVEKRMQSVSGKTYTLAEIGEGLLATMVESGIDSIHRQVYQAATGTAQQIVAAMEKGLAGGSIAIADLFDRNYTPIVNTNPLKHTTRFDKFLDSILPAIQDPLLETNPKFVFAIAVDDRGYCGCHNKKFSQPLSGNYQKDLAGNRTKRLFNDHTGLRSAANKEHLLIQTYKRDTGEIMHDLSVPLFINGRHWGAFRIGYKP